MRELSESVAHLPAMERREALRQFMRFMMRRFTGEAPQRFLRISHIYISVRISHVCLLYAAAYEDTYNQTHCSR